jgi:hypothetical protein
MGSNFPQCQFFTYMPRIWQRHADTFIANLIPFLVLSPVSLSTFENLVYDYENGMPCAIASVERREQC